jgi:hypothetical protein
MSDMVKVTICDGKYTIIQDASGRTKLLRYGEPWRWVTGDNVILGAAYEIQKLQERINQLEDARTIAAANSLANMMSHEDALAKIKRLEEGGDEAIYPFEYAARVRIWTEAKETSQ